MARMTITDDEGTVFASHEITAGMDAPFGRLADEAASIEIGAMLDDLATAARNKKRALKLGKPWHMIAKGE